MIHTIPIAIRVFLMGACLILSIQACRLVNRQQVTHPHDYNVYLNSHEPAIALDSTATGLTGSVASGFGRMATEFRQSYCRTGRIEFLRQAERELHKAVSTSYTGKASYLRTLAKNYLIQHRFEEALEFATSARSLKHGTAHTQYLLFDIHMEMASFGRARKYLDSLTDRSEYQYLIRLARWKARNGDLSAAIALMRQASVQASETGNRNMRVRSFLQLADYYGRSGRIRESYRTYLKALSLDPANTAAKKGIAWIVYSYEKNPKEALRILDSVTSYYKAPDLILLKAEIADYMEDEEVRSYHLDQYFKLIANPAYGNMYNAESIRCYLRETGQYERALTLARLEVKMRPTPASYGLLAYSFLKTGQQDTAKAIADRHILGETSDPQTLLQAAEIYKAGGHDRKVDVLKTKLAASLFELGPDDGERVRNL